MAGCAVWIPAAVASGSFVRYTLLPQGFFGGLFCGLLRV